VKTSKATNRRPVWPRPNYVAEQTVVKSPGNVGAGAVVDVEEYKSLQAACQELELECDLLKLEVNQLTEVERRFGRLKLKNEKLDEELDSLEKEKNKLEDYVIKLTDLEKDYENSQQCRDRLNKDIKICETRLTGMDGLVGLPRDGSEQKPPSLDELDAEYEMLKKQLADKKQQHM
jgi:uncharacterized protein (DUF3084 family)